MLDIRYRLLFRKYRRFSMIPQRIFLGNLRLAQELTPKTGAVVECGVWRGGMSAAIAEALGPERDYYLFDSFEGLPKAREIDGPAAVAWQQDTASPTYFDNCRANMREAQEAMAMSGATRTHFVPGWFADTLPTFPTHLPIALLRLDGDWYDSTMQCLTLLYERVMNGGLVIIDDYYAWDGCARAVHEFLARTSEPCRLRQSEAGISFLVKPGSAVSSAAHGQA